MCGVSKIIQQAHSTSIAPSVSPNKAMQIGLGLSVVSSHEADALQEHPQRPGGVIAIATIGIRFSELLNC